MHTQGSKRGQRMDVTPKDSLSWPKFHIPKVYSSQWGLPHRSAQISISHHHSKQVPPSHSQFCWPLSHPDYMTSPQQSSHPAAQDPSDNRITTACRLWVACTHLSIVPLQEPQRTDPVPLTSAPFSPPLQILSPLHNRQHAHECWP